MKKILSLILLAVMLTSVFTSCGNIPDDTTTTTTQNGQNPPSGGNPSGGNPSGGNPSGSIPSKMPVTKNDIEDFDSTITDKGFEIKGKKLSYTKGSNNALILNVKNTTDKNYSITITVNYFGADGVEAIKTEKQSRTGFASGYDRYFLFQPKISYDNYTCSIEVTEYTGECLEQYINSIKCSMLHEKRTWLGYNDSNGSAVFGEGIEIDYVMTNTYSQKLYYAATYICLDNQGRLYSIDDTQRQNYIDANSSYEGGTSRYVYDTDGNRIMALPNQLIWPDELKDNVTVIVIFKAVSTDWLV